MTAGMKTALFTAGLGDVIRNIYLRDAYRMISETTEPVRVIVASINPFATEIFRFHRNARQFMLLDLGHKFEEFIDAGVRGVELNRALCEFAGVEHRDVHHGDASGPPPVFDAPDGVDSRGHIVFCPFTGSVASRVFPDGFTERIANVLRAQPRPVYVITRSFPRRSHATGRTIHGIEDARRFEGGNIHVMEHLSVPACLNLVRDSAAYVGSWSSMHQAAWFENKPVAVFYPRNWVDVVQRTDYAFGIDRPDCFHSDVPSADMNALSQWLTRLP